MAVKQELDINIDADGNIQIEVAGPKGSGCVDLTREIEEALGIVVNRTYTSEYYQQEEAQRTTIKLGND